MNNLICYSLTYFICGMQINGANVTQINPNAPEDTVLVQVKAVVDQGNARYGQTLLERYLVQHPESTKALFTLGWVQFREDLPNDSLLTYTRAAKLATPSASDLYYVALDYVLLKDYADADKWMSHSVEMNNADGEAWYSLGRIKYTENRFLEAVQAFRKALTLMPGSVKTENNLGLAYEGLNRPDEALEAYRQALRWQQGSAHESEQPYINLGNLLTDRNSLDEALSLLQRAAAIAPEDSKVHASLGKVYARRNDYPMAQKEFEQALLKNQNDASLHFQLGQVFRKQGLQEASKKELDRAAQLAGTHSVEPGNLD